VGVIKTHDTVIGGKSYSTKPFDGVEALTMLPRLMAILPDRVANILFQKDTEKVEKLFENEEVIRELGLDVVKYVADEGLDLRVLRDLLKNTDCTAGGYLDGENDTVTINMSEKFGRHFQNDYFHLFRVAWWVGLVFFTGPSIEN